MKILILYFSAVGATKKVAKMVEKNLSEHEVDCYSIEEKKLKDFSFYDALIVGTPTHHAEPAKLLINYIDTIPIQNQKIPTFVFNTKGFGSCHTNRILAKKLLSKNLITIYDADYVAPASDGSLFLPKLKRFFKFEKDIEEKVRQDCIHFLKMVSQREGEVIANIPPFRLSTLINAPNKFGSQFVKMKIHLHQYACIKCELCVKNCPYYAIEVDEAGYPIIMKSKCTNCYRCIHSCPTRALGLWKKKKHSKVLKY